MHGRVTKQTTLRHRLSGFSGDEIDRTSSRDWSNCRACGLCRTRKRVALKRRGEVHGGGRVRLLLIGEAPGEFEDTLGVPFIGPAGQVLNFILKDVEAPFTYLITNTVNCRPYTIVYLSQEAEDVDFDLLIEGEDYEIQDPNRDPTPQEATACRSHIDELVIDFEPTAIVYLGKIAQQYPTRLPTLSLLHPAYIARMEYKLQTVREQALLLTRFIQGLS